MVMLGITLLILLLRGAECSKAPEQGCKTRWFDRDDPSGKGDYETLTHLVKEYPGQICTNPIGIKVRTLDGSPLQTSLVQFSDTTSGFGCVNNFLSPAGMCKDYEVQFTCPDSFCSGCKTRWFDRDDPSGKGDYETLTHLVKEYPGQICTNPIGIKVRTLDGSPLQTSLVQFSDTTSGFGCVNNFLSPAGMCKDYEVQFTCPDSFCSVCTTQWFDRDDPSGYGDYETLSDLRTEYPGQICTNPIGIEVRTIDGSPLQTSLIQFSDTTSGFGCVNKLTPPQGYCKDYTVRFTCPAAFCSGKAH
uniref:Cartilage intermediate layer protein 1-like isoform X2 n=1 Tax=Geotrypetes seraphini TaxID=260995 RepID=A0A6P8PP24_GEOSA|nr:cartilage intermediate layer protein 1-like isoform X2 [Geotrypetes seraphini]